jgi:hypothetical protein
MYVQTIDQESLAIDPGRIREVIAVTRCWWGIGEGRRLRPLGALAPDEVLQALQAGERVQWQGWSIRTTAPRRIGLPLGESAWAAGILAVSAHGLASELHVSAEGVQRICLRIAQMDGRKARASRAELQDRAWPQWELEDH